MATGPVVYKAMLFLIYRSEKWAIASNIWRLYFIGFQKPGFRRIVPEYDENSSRQFNHTNEYLVSDVRNIYSERQPVDVVGNFRIEIKVHISISSFVNTLVCF